MAFGDLLGTLSVAQNSILDPCSATGSVAVTIGDLIFAVIGEQTSLTTVGVTDNLGNTYTATNAGTDAGTSTGRAFYSRVTKNGTLTTVSADTTASTDNVAFVVDVYAGPIDFADLDKNPANITSDITSPFTCPPTGTLSQANELVLVWGVATGSTVWSATSPNLIGGQLATAAVLHTVIGHQVVAATTDISPAFTAGANPTDAVLGTSTFRQFVNPFPVGRHGDTSTTEQPTPQREKRGTAIAAEPGVWQNLLSTLLAPVAVEYIWRAPFSVPRWLRPLTAGFIATGLALTTVVAEPAPFSQTNWPNPRGHKPRQDYQQSTNLGLLTTTGTKPFLQAVWPVPKGYPPRQDYQLHGADLLLNPPSAVVLREPLITRIERRSSYVAITAMFNRGNMTVPAALPIGRQLDWPNPLRPRRNPDYQFGLNINLYGQDATFGPTIWGQPRDIPHDGIVEPFPNLVLNSAVFAGPFGQDDWPNPRGHKPRADYQQSLNLGLRTTTGTQPFAQDDWPNPRGKKPVVADHDLPFNLALFTTPPSPFFQTSWPNPRGHLPRQDYRQPLNVVLRTTTGVKPHQQLNWPLPVTLRRQNPYYQQQLNLPLRTTTGTKPFQQRDWVNPRGFRPLNVGGQICNLVLTATPPAPSERPANVLFMSNIGRMMNRP